jgi:hypothetical protein
MADLLPVCSIFFALGLLTNCGSTMQQPPPPPVGDFSLSASPTQINATLGATSPAIQLSVTALQGFTGTVSISFSGLPAGATTTPASPFTITAGASQSFTVSIPESSAAGMYSIQAKGTSGTLSHTQQVGMALNPSVSPTVTTTDDGTLFVLQTQTATDTVRIGLLKAWGAAIIEVSLNGVDYVNNDDPGRQIQTSLWDANASYSPDWGYNPIESGDHFFNGSPVLAFTLLSDSIYTKTQPIQWAPENFGGGPSSPVLGDAYIEKWISVVPGFNRVFRVHYKITHFGTDLQADAFQEAPVMYVNPNVPNFSYYGGGSPWTGDTLSQHTMSFNCCDMLATTELWGAYVDNNSTGIAVYTPQQFPNSKGFNAGSTLQFTPMCPYTWEPGGILEFDTFVLVGNVNEMRAAIYALHNPQTSQSTLPPMGNPDSPSNGDVLTGTASVEGWAWALPGMSSVQVFVDGNLVGTANYNLSRPDIPVAFPRAPSDVGYQYSLDTTAFANGSHAIVVKATDNNSHVATFATRTVTINN